MKQLLEKKYLSSLMLRFWWVILLAGGIAALTSYLVGTIFLRPIYVADAKLSISINFKDVGHLSQYEQDQMIGNVTSLFLSEDVVTKTVQQLNNEQFTNDDFRNQCFIERQVNEILFRCKSDKPETSQSLATIWGNFAHNELETAYFHAMEYERLKKIQNSYEKCIENSVGYHPIPINCSNIQPNEMTLEEINQQIDNESLLSKNIFTGFTYSDLIPANKPERAIRFQMNTLVFVGTLLGAFLSIIFLFTLRNEE